MYDFVSEVPKGSLKLKKLDISSVPDFPDLTTPEISFNFHNYIDISNQVPAETLLVDILAEESRRSANTVPVTNIPAPVTNIPSADFDFPMPQSVGFSSDRYGSGAGIKQEPAAGIENYNSFASRSTDGYVCNGIPQLPDTVLTSAAFGGDQREVSYKSDDKKSCKKLLDKESEEYRRRRERNNRAVQKCRKKAKQRWNVTERRVSDLGSENDQLRKRVELLSKELSVLKNLLSNVGMPPDEAAKTVD